MMDSLPKFATPGTPLGPSSKYIAGSGTHVHNGQVVASLLGQVTSTSTSTTTSTPEPGNTTGPAKRLNRLTTDTATLPPQPQQTLSVARPHKRREVLPEVGNTVLGCVVRLMPRQAIVAIRQVGDTPLATEWQGVIRVQDVRATEKDRVRVLESFRSGDLVRAQVISLGDQANYYLSTASNELGVIMATSDAGNDMVPVSWKEYRDMETGHSEPRKVAKPA